MKRIRKWSDFECVIWEGRINSDGYGMVGQKLAHRVVYEQEKGPIPDGLELDHLCDVRACVQVKHLDPVTHLENIKRGRSHKWRNDITHCPQGHKYTEGNTGYTVIKREGRPITVSRYCKDCKRIKARERRIRLGV